MASQEYPLLRNYKASSRLNLQHLVWTRMHGYLIHPSISLQPDAVIGEVGVGTGAWLLDVAQELPKSMIFRGFDVDLSQLPHANWLPGNVSVGKLDIFEPTPPDLQGCFDLTHVRFFLCVVRQSDPSPVIQNLISMTKKGGYVQWTDQDPYTFRLMKADEGLKAPHTEELFHLLKSRLQGFAGIYPGWIARLDSYFSQCGLENIQINRRSKRVDDLVTFHDSLLLVMEELSYFLPGENDGTELRKLIALAAQELEESGRGLAITNESVTVVGRRVR